MLCNFYDNFYDTTPTGLIAVHHHFLDSRIHLVTPIIWKVPDAIKMPNFPEDININSDNNILQWMLVTEAQQILARCLIVESSQVTAADPHWHLVIVRRIDTLSFWIDPTEALLVCLQQHGCTLFWRQFLDSRLRQRKHLVWMHLPSGNYMPHNTTERPIDQPITSNTFNAMQSVIMTCPCVSWLVFNGTFSTSRLYHAMSGQEFLQHTYS